MDLGMISDEAVWAGVGWLVGGIELDMVMLWGVDWKRGLMRVRVLVFDGETTLVLPILVGRVL